ncbi:glycoside hydrolase family 38 C-terminal domain-containing protein [Plantibacter sp. YIM 135249]|uniref:alpha-mannosidase n=1 Tax=Plantibacter sp. YIM 135249 TaxID=3423918 RepID=UPI003D3431A7
MHNDAVFVEGRIEKFLRLLVPAIDRETAPVRLAQWRVGGEPVPFAMAVAAEYSAMAVGDRWGAPWDTVWIRVSGEVPLRWLGGELGDELASGRTAVELVVDLGFDDRPGFQAEGLVHRPDGRIVKAISPRNAWVPVDEAAVDLLIEAAANPDVAGEYTFDPTPLGDRATAGSEPGYTLRRLELRLRDVTVWELQQDVVALLGLARALPVELPRRAELLNALAAMIDVVDPDDIAGTAAAGREALQPALAKPAYASAHQIVAVGHAHIDSAWLWPVRETIRKCARTFSNVLALAEADPTFRFACSSAQQLAWMQEHYPALFERIQAAVARGQFIPVGGMWVESDTNMPGGEAMARQFVEGKRFFLDAFGIDTQEVWLPDSFGYSAALPQIVAASGSRYFLTQKISWNDTNRMPHHTFLWEGIDGTRVFTHFPPVDTYNSELSATELAHAQANYREKGTGTVSLVPFGWGDGGGGPTREMLAAAKRTASLEGSPAVSIDSPLAFFERAEAEIPDPPVWVGELYLELHRGIFTSQARTKQGNRRCEHLLREAELWAATAAVRCGAVYPQDELRVLWRLVLLQQFHDILPGSSIAWVHQDAERNYAAVGARAERIIAEALRVLGGGVPGGAGGSDGVDGAQRTVMLANARPHAASGVPSLGIGPLAEAGIDADDPAATIEEDADGFVLDNGIVRARIDRRGLLASLIDHASGRDAVPAGQPGNLLQLHRDIPNQWDAWDIDAHYRRTGRDLVACESVVGILVEGAATVTVTRSFGASRIVQHLSLRPGSPSLEIDNRVSWHETHKLLKLAFPFDLRAGQFAAETQFGHVFRPTHTNTSWDAARYEVCAHRWVHVGEPGYGVAVSNDSTYGHDVTSAPAAGQGAEVRAAAGAGAGAGAAGARAAADAGAGADAGADADADADAGAGARARAGTVTTVRLSLLRGPTFPDPFADQGEHRMLVTVRPCASLGDAVEEGYRVNLPARVVRAVAPVAPLVSVSSPAVIVEAVKLAEDGSGDVIVRLYESLGSRASTTVTAGFPASRVTEVDLLERDLGPGAAPVPAAPAVGPDVGPAVGPDIGPAAGPDIGPAVGPDIGPAVRPDVGPAVCPDLGPAVRPDVGPAVGPDVGPAVGPDLRPGGGPDIGPAVGPDLGPAVVIDLVLRSFQLVTLRFAR